MSAGTRYLLIVAVVAVVAGWLLFAGSGLKAPPPASSASPTPALRSAPAATSTDRTAAPIEAAAVAPPGLSPAFQDPAIEAIAALARAWSTGTDWARVVSSDGLRIAAPEREPTLIPVEVLARSRAEPPALPTSDCPEGTLHHVGDAFLTAYFAKGAKIGRWGSEPAADCYGVGEPSRLAVRVCVERKSTRVRSIEFGRHGSFDDNPSFDIPAWEATGSSQGETAVDEFYNVVLLEDGDSLVARSAPRPGAEVVHRFPATARGLEGTGKTTQVGADIWVEIVTPSGRGWVERTLVCRARTADQMRVDGRYARAIDEVWMAISGAETAVVGRRGLFVTHYGSPVQVPSNNWSSAIKESRKMDGAACEGCVVGSLQKIVGEALTDALRDANSQWTYGEIRGGGNRSWLVPDTFAGFNVVSVYDPHDAGCTDFEWKTAIFFFDEERGAPKLVGIAFDSWSP